MSGAPASQSIASASRIIGSSPGNSISRTEPCAATTRPVSGPGASTPPAAALGGDSTAVGKMARLPRMRPERGKSEQPLEPSVLSVEIVEEEHLAVLLRKHGSVENDHAYRPREPHPKGLRTIHGGLDPGGGPIARRVAQHQCGQRHGIADSDAAVAEGATLPQEEVLRRRRMQIDIVAVRQ